MASDTLPLGDTGRVRIYIRGTQTAAMTVKIAQVGGRRVGGTNPGGYTCTTSGTSVVAPALNAYGRKLVGRHRPTGGKAHLRLVNGSGVTHTRVLSGVIRPAGDVTARAPCAHATAHTSQSESNAPMARTFSLGGEPLHRRVPRPPSASSPICRTLGVSAAPTMSAPPADSRLALSATSGWLSASSRWLALKRGGIEARRDRVKRLMGAHGIQGAKRRVKPWRTTMPELKTPNTDVDVPHRTQAAT